MTSSITNTTLHNEDAFQETEADFDKFKTATATGSPEEVQQELNAQMESNTVVSKAKVAAGLQKQTAISQGIDKVMQREAYAEAKELEKDLSNKMSEIPSVNPDAPETETIIDIEVDPRELPYMLNIALKERDEANTKGTALKARVAFYADWINGVKEAAAANNIDLDKLLKDHLLKKKSESKG